MKLMKLAHTNHRLQALLAGSGTAPALRGGASLMAGIALPVLIFGMLGVVHAQDAAEERSQSFQAVKGAVQEDVPGGPLLVYAYGFILLIVIGYLVRLVRLQQRSERELARLAQQLGKTST